MTKREALAEFNENVKPLVFAQYGENDKPALREAWSNYTDWLCKDSRITQHQYDTWTGPFP